jgi:hypothetical protein
MHASWAAGKSLGVAVEQRGEARVFCPRRCTRYSCAHQSRTRARGRRQCGPRETRLPLPVAEDNGVPRLEPFENLLPQGFAESLLVCTCCS